MRSKVPRFRSLFRRHRAKIRFLLLTILGTILGFSVTLSLQTLNQPLHTHRVGRNIQMTNSNSNDADDDVRCNHVLEERGEADGYQHSSFLSDYHFSPPSNDSLPHNAAQFLDSSSRSIKDFRGLLFVGVMTAQKYLNSRAVAINETWAQTLPPGDFAFFVGEDVAGLDSGTPATSLPLVRLAGVPDTLYPPQLKSFRMLKYMYDNYVDQYEWFLRADDDVYLRGDKLEVFLRSISSNRVLFIGQAGLGTPDEYGTLSLGDDENYCMGGTGMILSRAALRKVGPHLAGCESEMLTTHEDVEIGRCIRRYAGVTCTWSYEMQSIFYNNQSGLAAYTGDLNVPEVARAITLHPLKRTHLMYRMHALVRKLKLTDLRYRALQLNRDASSTHLATVRRSRDRENKPTDMTPDDDDLDWNQPSLLRSRPKSIDSIGVWEFLSPQILFCARAPNCPRHNVESQQKYALNDISRQVLDTLNKHSRQRGRLLVFQEILYTYRRLSPLHGIDYVVDLLLLYKKFKGRKITVPVRRHAYVQQSFAASEIIDDAVLWCSASLDPSQNSIFDSNRNRVENSSNNISSVTSRDQFSSAIMESVEAKSWSIAKNDERVNFVLAISGRFPTFQRFLANFERQCLQAGENVSLTVVLFRSNNNATSSAFSDPSENDDTEDDTEEFDEQGQHNHGGVPRNGFTRFKVAVESANHNSNKNQDQSAQYQKQGNNKQDYGADGQDQAEDMELEQKLPEDSDPQRKDRVAAPVISDDEEPRPISENDRILQLFTELKSRWQKTDKDGSQASYIFNLIEAPGPFSRGLGLSIGAQSLPADALLFFTDVDIVFTQDVFRRLRRNTVRGRQVFFPVVFSEYDHRYNTIPLSTQPKPVTGELQAANASPASITDDFARYFQLGPRSGYFRHFGFGIASLYRSDLDTVGGFRTTVQGWGLEDVDLFEKFLKHALVAGTFTPDIRGIETLGYTVFRAPEPGLVHVFHPVICDPQLSKSQFEMCLGSKAASLASVPALAEHIFEQRKTEPFFVKFFEEETIASSDDFRDRGYSRYPWHGRIR